MDKTKNKSGGSGVDASTIKNYSQEEKYKAEVSMLKLFISKFNKYVSQVVKENPCDKTRKIDAVARTINDILSEKETPSYTSVEKIKEIYTLICDEEVKDSFYGEGVNGFRLDDVLNPKETLDLEELLSELGVTKK